MAKGSLSKIVWSPWKERLEAERGLRLELNIYPLTLLNLHHTLFYFKII